MKVLRKIIDLICDPFITLAVLIEESKNANEDGSWDGYWERKAKRKERKKNVLRNR